MPSKPKGQAKAEPIVEMLDRMASSVCLCFAKKPVIAREVAAAETALGIQLPRAYVDLVTQQGVFWLEEFYGGKPAGNPFDELFSPSRAVKATRDHRKMLNGMIRDGDPISREMVDSMVVFFHHGGGNVAVFDSTQRKGRDLAVHDLYLDDIPLTWPRKPFVGFDEFIRAQLSKDFPAARS